MQRPRGLKAMGNMESDSEWWYDRCSKAVGVFLGGWEKGLNCVNDDDLFIYMRWWIMKELN